VAGCITENSNGTLDQDWLPLLSFNFEKQYVNSFFESAKVRGSLFSCFSMRCPRYFALLVIFLIVALYINIKSFFNSF